MTLLGKVLFPWWSSLKPYILSKVMQLRLLLRRKYSFCLLCFHILCTHASAAAAPALSSAISRLQTSTWMSENYSLQGQVFSTLFVWTPLTLAGEKTSRAGSALSLIRKCCASVQDISYTWYIFLLEMKNPPGNGNFNNACKKKSKLIN